MVLEDLTAGYSKPQVLDVQIGPNHVGTEEAGSAPRVGLRLNGMQVRGLLLLLGLCTAAAAAADVVLVMQRHTADGKKERKSKKDGNQVTSNDWGHEIENFLTDETNTRVTD